MKNNRQQLLVTSQSPIVFHTAIIKVMEIKLVMLNIIKVNIHLVIDLCAAFNVLSLLSQLSCSVHANRSFFYVASNDLRYNRKIAQRILWEIQQQKLQKKQKLWIKNVSFFCGIWFLEISAFVFNGLVKWTIRLDEVYLQNILKKIY